MFVVAFAALAPLMILWSLASPLMSSPDEPAHAMRAAAVVRGDLFGESSVSFPGTTEVTAPRYLAESGTTLACFRFDVSSSPECQSFDPSDADDLVTAYTTAASNPPLFYGMVGWPTLALSGAAAIYAMRIVGALVCSALLAVSFLALARMGAARWSLIALSAAITPMVLFLSGTVNPNGLEVCAALATFTTMMSILRNRPDSRTLPVRLTIMTASALLLIGTRSISLLWLLLITVIAAVVGSRSVIVDVFRKPAAWAASTVIGLGTAGVLAYVAFGPSEERLSYTPVGAGTGQREAFLSMLDRTFDFAIGWIGQFGWLDTPAPGFTLIVWAAAAGALVVGALAWSDATARSCIAGILLVLVLIPPIVQAAVVEEVGYIWQGRYTLVPFVLLLTFSGISLDRRIGRWSAHTRMVVILAAVTIGVAHCLAFVWALRRYVITLSDGLTWIDMVIRPVWQPPLGWIPLTTVFVLAVAVGTLVLIRTVNRGQRPPVGVSEMSSESTSPTA